MREKLQEAARTGLDMSPGDPVAAWAEKHIAELEAALRKIAAPTYGTEINDTDAERADCYWTHLQRFQDIARKALGS